MFQEIVPFELFVWLAIAVCAALACVKERR